MQMLASSVTFVGHPCMQPLLSIVVPALQPDLELRRCVESIVLACPDRSLCEIVIVVPAREAEATRRLDLPGTRIIAERRRGIYAAMNDGLAVSTGHYVYFIGKDDIVLPQFAELFPYLRERSACAVTFDVYWGGDGVYSGRPSRWSILRRNLCHQGVVYSTDTMIELGPFLRRMRIRADHFINLRMLWGRRFRGRIRYLNRALVWFSATGVSTHSPSDKVFERLKPLIFRKYVGRWAEGILMARRTLQSWRRRRQT